MSRKYSIVTTCKGRLHNLKRTLPEFVRQKNAEVIVVDYDCPDGTAEYVRQNHPNVWLVTVNDKPKFNTSHARNLGAAKASGKFLVFLDADVIIPEGFTRYLDGQLKGHSFGLFGAPLKSSLRGSCIVWREDFERVGGYDELMGAYDGEDMDLYFRLRLVGSKEIELDPNVVIEVIDQTTEERERFREPDIRRQFLRGQLYAGIKEMIMQLQETPNLDLALRQRLLDDVKKGLPALYSGEQEFRLEVDLGDKYNRGYLADWEFSRSVAIRARKRL